MHDDSFVSLVDLAETLVRVAPHPPPVTAVIDAMRAVGVPEHRARRAVERALEVGTIAYDARLTLTAKGDVR